MRPRPAGSSHPPESQGARVAFDSQKPGATLILQPPGSGLSFPNCAMGGRDRLKAKCLLPLGGSASLLTFDFLSDFLVAMGLREGEA